MRSPPWQTCPSRPSTHFQPSGPAGNGSGSGRAFSARRIRIAPQAAALGSVRAAPAAKRRQAATEHGGAARAAGALADNPEYGNVGVLARIASDASEAKTAAWAVADAARKAVGEAAGGGGVDVSAAGGNGAGATSDAGHAGPESDPAVRVAEHIHVAVHDASSGIVGECGSAAAFAARTAYDAAYAVHYATVAAACVAHATADARTPAVDGPAGDAAAAAQAIADAVDSSTADARALHRNLDEMIAAMATPNREPAVAKAVKEAAYAGRRVSAAVRRARAMAARTESDCRAAIELYG